MGKGKARDPLFNIIIYGCLFITAFWCAAIAAPVMWSLETNREKDWPLVECLVVKHSCCRSNCGKSGCSYQPRWRVQFNRTDPGYEGVSWVGSYYGDPGQWSKRREGAEDKMYDYEVGTRFPCQYDPKFEDEYRYVLRPGMFYVEEYFIWTIVMYAIAGPLCILPAIGYGLYKLFNCWCSDCDCCNRSSKAKKYNTYSLNNISAPAPYTPSGNNEVALKPTAVNYGPVETPAHAEAPVLVPLAETPGARFTPGQYDSSSITSSSVDSGSGDVSNMPVY